MCASNPQRAATPPSSPPLPSPPTPFAFAARAEIERAETKTKKSVKDAAKRGDVGTAKMLAKEVVRSRKAVSKLHTSKATMNSVVMQMENQMAQQKVTGHMQKSTEVMKMMSKLVKVSEVQDTMLALQKEMCKAGVIEEMVDDAMDALDDDDAEDEADDAVAKVFEELAIEATGDMASASTAKVETAQEAQKDEEEDEDMKAMEQRLAALKG